MAEELPKNEIFILLSNRHRRLLLRILQRSSTPLTTIQLARRIGNHEDEDEDPSAEEIQSIYLTLCHNHLPRLAETDVVEYDPDVATVRLGPNFERLIQVLENVRDDDLPWTEK